MAQASSYREILSLALGAEPRAPEPSLFSFVARVLAQGLEFLVGQSLLIGSCRRRRRLWCCVFVADSSLGRVSAHFDGIGGSFAVLASVFDELWALGSAVSV